MSNANSHLWLLMDECINKLYHEQSRERAIAEALCGEKAFCAIAKDLSISNERLRQIASKMIIEIQKELNLKITPYPSFRMSKKGRDEN